MQKLTKKEGMLLLGAVICLGLAGVCIHADRAGKQEQPMEMAQLQEAQLAGEQYDYDKALAMLEKIETDNADLQAVIEKRIGEYTDKKETLVRVENVDMTPHIFFHPLIVDTSLAFGEDSGDPVGYNQFMTTVSEFNAILGQLYENDYVLVSEHDLYQITDEGVTEGDIYLPQNKRPIVISQDDVNYYDKWAGDGFATRMVEIDGRIECEYINKDGNVEFGDFDLVPILDQFVEEHPDFSYRGAKATIAVTGYEGVFGYHAIADADHDDYERQSESAKKVADTLRATGYDIASHSYGHISYAEVSAERVQEDLDEWKRSIEPVVGATDLFIYPYGADITSNVRKDAYEEEEKYEILYGGGFRYFLNVDSSVNAWSNVNTGYVRRGRRNIDGYRMDHYAEKMVDLFYDIDQIFDESRPAGDVPELGSSGGDF